MNEAIKETIVVCGLARCGTSLMMKMLHAGGVEPLCDPECLGFSYEYDLTTRLPHNVAWLSLAEGRALKLLDPHRWQLPKDRPYLFILLSRNTEEQAKSHIKFLKALGVPVSRKDVPLVEQSLRRDLPVARTLLSSYPQSSVLELRFENILRKPLTAAGKVSEFIKRDDFDVAAATRVVMKRSPECLPYLLELRQVQGIEA